MHPLTTWLALAGSVWALFALAEEHIAAPHRVQITRWLRCQTPYWPATFVAVCDSVFGTPTLSGAYVLRACIASHIAAFLALCLSGVFYPGTSGLILLVLFLYAPALVGSLALVNLLPGSLSLLVHRALLQRVSDGQGPPRVGTWLVLASATTGVLAVLACTLGFLVVFVSNQIHALQRPVTWIIGYVESVIKDTAGGLSALQEASAPAAHHYAGDGVSLLWDLVLHALFPVRLGVVISPVRCIDPRRHGLRAHACVQTCTELAGY